MQGLDAGGTTGASPVPPTSEPLRSDESESSPRSASLGVGERVGARWRTAVAVASTCSTPSLSAGSLREANAPGSPTPSNIVETALALPESPDSSCKPKFQPASLRASPGEAVGPAHEHLGSRIFELHGLHAKKLEAMRAAMERRQQEEQEAERQTREEEQRIARLHRDRVRDVVDRLAREDLEHRQERLAGATAAHRSGENNFYHPAIKGEVLAEDQEGVLGENRIMALWEWNEKRLARREQMVLQRSDAEIAYMEEHSVHKRAKSRPRDEDDDDDQPVAERLYEIAIEQRDRLEQLKAEQLKEETEAIMKDFIHPREPTAEHYADAFDRSERLFLEHVDRARRMQDRQYRSWRRQQDAFQEKVFRCRRRFRGERPRDFLYKDAQGRAHRRDLLAKSKEEQEIADLRSRSVHAAAQASRQNWSVGDLQEVTERLACTAPERRERWKEQRAASESPQRGALFASRFVASAESPVCPLTISVESPAPPSAPGPATQQAAAPAATTSSRLDVGEDTLQPPGVASRAPVRRTSRRGQPQPQSQVVSRLEESQLATFAIETPSPALQAPSAPSRAASRQMLSSEESSVAPARPMARRSDLAEPGVAKAPSARLEPGHGAGRRRISNMSRSASAEPETSNRLLAGKSELTTGRHAGARSPSRSQLSIAEDFVVKKAASSRVENVRSNSPQRHAPEDGGARPERNSVNGKRTASPPTVEPSQKAAEPTSTQTAAARAAAQPSTDTLQPGRMREPLSPVAEQGHPDVVRKASSARAAGGSPSKAAVPPLPLGETSAQKDRNNAMTMTKSDSRGIDKVRARVLAVSWAARAGVGSAALFKSAAAHHDEQRSTPMTIRKIRSDTSAMSPVAVRKLSGANSAASSMAPHQAGRGRKQAAGAAAAAAVSGSASPPPSASPVHAQEAVKSSYASSIRKERPAPKSRAASPGAGDGEAGRGAGAGARKGSPTGRGAKALARQPSVRIRSDYFAKSDRKERPRRNAADSESEAPAEGPEDEEAPEPERPPADGAPPETRGCPATSTPGPKRAAAKSARMGRGPPATTSATLSTKARGPYGSARPPSPRSPKSPRTPRSEQGPQEGEGAEPAAVGDEPFDGAGAEQLGDDAEAEVDSVEMVGSEVVGATGAPEELDAQEKEKDKEKEMRAEESSRRLFEQHNERQAKLEKKREELNATQTASTSSATKKGALTPRRSVHHLYNEAMRKRRRQRERECDVRAMKQHEHRRLKGNHHIRRASAFGATGRAGARGDGVVTGLRTDMVANVFRGLDGSGAGRLRSRQLHFFAWLCGFAAGEEAWVTEYRKLCVLYGWSLPDGVDMAQFMHLVGHKEGDAHLEDEELQDLQAVLRNRVAMVRSLFSKLDNERRGWLGSMQMRRYAGLCGFEGSDADWHKRWGEFCVTEKWRGPEPEVTLPQFQECVNHVGGPGFCSDQELYGALVEVGRGRVAHEWVM